MCRSLWATSRSGRISLALSLVLGLVLLVPSHVSAQAVTGTLLGNVTDSSGAAVPGATVTARETQTNVSRSVVTNETGYYILSSLQNGNYAVEAELQGFKKVVREGVRVDVNTTIRVDLKLEVGQLSVRSVCSSGVSAATWTVSDAGQRPGRSADLGREVRQRREVVPHQRRLAREPVTGELHAVAGVAREPDDHAVESLDRF